jgi:hypothetical protein
MRLAARETASFASDNRLAELADWDKDTLMMKLQALLSIG